MLKYSTLIILLVSLVFLAQCSGSGGSSEDLSELLANHSFSIVASDNVSITADASCSSISTNPDTTVTVSASSDAPPSLVKPRFATQIEVEGNISFTEDTYTISSITGTTIASGSWEAMDGNTIEITDNGDTVLLDVSTSGNSITVNNVTIVCNNSTSPGTTISKPAEESAEVYDETPSTTSSTVSSPGGEVDTEATVSPDIGIE